MKAAANEEKFEIAASLRDSMYTVKSILEKQAVINDNSDKSVFENETRDIFAKMVQALKLSPQHLLILEAQATIGATTQKVTAAHLQEWLVYVLKTPMKILILSEGETSGQIKGRHQFFVTHSPYYFVLQSSDLKKSCMVCYAKLRFVIRIED